MLRNKSYKFIFKCIIRCFEFSKTNRSLLKYVIRYDYGNVIEESNKLYENKISKIIKNYDINNYDDDYLNLVNDSIEIISSLLAANAKNVIYAYLFINNSEVMSKITGKFIIQKRSFMLTFFHLYFTIFRFCSSAEKKILIDKDIHGLAKRTLKNLMDDCLQENIQNDDSLIDLVLCILKLINEIIDSCHSIEQYNLSVFNSLSFDSDFGDILDFFKEKNEEINCIASIIEDKVFDQ